MTGSEDAFTSIGKANSRRSATRSNPSEPAARMMRYGWSMRRSNSERSVGGRARA